MEFVVTGPPISNQSQGTNLQAWRAAVQAEARTHWKNAAMLQGVLKAVIINFHEGEIDAPFVFVGASKVLISAVQAGQQFVYVRIEDVVTPFPLPK